MSANNKKVVSLASYRGYERMPTIPQRVTVVEKKVDDLHDKVDDINKNVKEMLEIFNHAKYGSKLIYICAKIAAWLGGTAVAILSGLELWTRFMQNNFPFK